MIQFALYAGNRNFKGLVEFLEQFDTLPRKPDLAPSFRINAMGELFELPLVRLSKNFSQI